jgi:hypothetical protein
MAVILLTNAVSQQKAPRKIAAEAIIQTRVH